MTAFKFLHAADLHLDSPLIGLARRGEAGTAFVEATRGALENLVAAAIAEEVAFVLIAGDIYDGNWRDYATGHFFARQMGRLARAGIRVFTIRGNHDAESVLTRSLELPSNIHALSVRAVETVRLDDIGVALHGRGFASRHVNENMTRDYPPALPGLFNIGLLHTSLSGRDGHATYAPCTIEDLERTGYDYWALGHVHEREVIAARGTTIVFPGNVQGRHARETGPKGATLVSVEDGRITELAPLALDVARFAATEIDLSGVENEAEMMSRARAAIARAHEAAEGRPLALRLTLTGQTPLHAGLTARAAQLEEDLQGMAWEASGDLLIEKLRLRTSGPRGAELAVIGFEEELAAVAADPAFAAEVAHTLAELLGKAPADALGLLGLDGADPDMPARAARVAIEAATALVGGALGGEAPSRTVTEGRR